MNRNLMWTKKTSLLNVRSQYERTEIAKAFLVDRSGHKRNLLEVSRNITMVIIGSWRQPRVPATRFSGSEPTAGSWGQRNQKFPRGNGRSA